MGPVGNKDGEKIEPEDGTAPFDSAIDEDTFWFDELSLGRFLAYENKVVGQMPAPRGTNLAFFLFFIFMGLFL